MDEEGFAKGNADELYRLRDQIRRADPDLVIVMSADHVYRLDYRDVSPPIATRAPRSPWWSPTSRACTARTPATTPSSRSTGSAG